MLLRLSSKTYGFSLDILRFFTVLFILPFTAQIKICLGFTPVPLALQNFIILSLVPFLGKEKGALVVLSYLLLGILGLPVFSVASCGFKALFSPTWGYLMGYLFASYLVAFLFEKGFNQSFLKRIFSYSFGFLTVHIFGFIFLSFLVGPLKAFIMGTLPFLAFDGLKVFFAASLFYPRSINE